MSITRFAENPGYHFSNKLHLHVITRSEADFAAAAARRAAIGSADVLADYAAFMRRGFEEAIGGVPYDPALPLHAEVTGVIRGEFFDIEKVIFQSRPSVYVTANLYIPHVRREPCGAVLFCPGHSEEGKAFSTYQTVARSIASAGLIVLLMDPVGQGERHSYIEDGIEVISGCTTDHEYAGKQVFLTGGAPCRYFIADARRAVDYLISRPEVDAEAIGITGSSGGGTMTCNMMVCEPRAKAAAPGTFLSSRRTILHSGQPQDAEQIWMGQNGFTFDHADVLACFAPKPCLVLCVDSDFFPLEGTLETMDTGRRLYGLCSAADALDMIVDHSTHAYTRVLAARAAAFFARHLNGEDRRAIPEALEPIDGALLNCTATGQVRSAIPGARSIFDENRERVEQAAAGLTRADAAAFVREKVYHDRRPAPIRLREYPARSGSGMQARMYLWSAQDNLPNFGVLVRRAGASGAVPVTVCLFEQGMTDLAAHETRIRRILDEGRAAFVVDVTGLGFCAPERCTGGDIHGIFGTVDVLSKDLCMLGDSLAAIRLYDLERIPEVLAALGFDDYSICGVGNAAILARLHGLLHEVTVEAEGQTITDIVSSRYYSDHGLAGYILPGIAPYAAALGI